MRRTARTSSGSEQRLVCPGCGATHPPAERFCPDCSLPLTYAEAGDAGGEPELQVTERQARARKVKPQLAEGPLVKVAWTGNQAEAELVQGLLLEEGVPSTLRRAAGFDVPDFLAAGPRDVLVPASGADVAHEALLHTRAGDEAAGAGRVAVDRPLRVLAGVLLAFALVALIAWAGTALLG